GEPASSPTTAAPTTTTTTEVVPSRLATMVPGMLDVLVAGAVNRNGMQVVTKWEPSDRAPTVETLPWGVFISDASATWLASNIRNRWVTGATLWVGNTAHMEPVTSSLASGPVWHTRFPGQVAWLETTPEGRFLYTTQFVAGQTATRRPIVAVDDTANLVGWTDAGFLMTRYGPGSGELELRDGAGEILTSREIASGPLAVGRDLIFATDLDGTGVILDHNLQAVAVAPWDTDCHRVVWGPTGNQAAVRCGFGNEQRLEYWQDPLIQTAPVYGFVGEEVTDIGFTTNGILYAVTIESLRPSSTINFFIPAERQSYEVAYPGLVQWVTAVRS
ncbi:MAG: hypothetical protein WD990_01355, partial [Acidimicrobiia bacterium]